MTYLWRLHVEHFSDPALHDKEVWVVNIELNRSEQILNSCVVHIAPVDQVFVTSSYNHL